MKTLGRLLIVAVLLVLLAVGAVFFYLDAIAKTAIERGATYALGVRTTLGSADVGVLRGRFAMDRLAVANPEGFERDHFLELRRGEMAVTLGTLRQEIVELPHLRLSQINLNLEKKGGQANYKVILDNLKKLESKKSPGDQEPAGEAGGKRFIIREITVSDVNVSVDLLEIGGNLTRLDVPIEEIRLQNVGSHTNQGVVVAELTDILIKAILTAVLNKAGTMLPTEFFKDLSGSLDEMTNLADMGIKMTSVLDGSIVDLTGKSMEEVGKLGEQAGSAGDQLEKVGEEVQKAMDGVGDLFGGKKKDG